MEDLENVLNRARKLLADISALLELEIDRLFKAELDEGESVRLDEVMGLIKQTQKAMQTVLDLEVKYGLAPYDTRANLDLEAARAEIVERLRRLSGVAA